MQNAAERIARIIENDGAGAIKRTLRVAQSDILALLGEFMEVTGLDMVVEPVDRGYMLVIRAEVGRFFDIGNISAGSGDI